MGFRDHRFLRIADDLTATIQCTPTTRGALIFDPYSDQGLAFLRRRGEAVRGLTTFQSNYWPSYQTLNKLGIVVDDLQLEALLRPFLQRTSSVIREE